MTGRTSIGPPGPRSVPPSKNKPVISTKSMELARNFLSALFMGVRTSQLHDPSNKAFENAVRQVRDAAQALIAATGGFQIQFVEESAFLNGARIRFEGGVYESMRKLRTILESRQLGGIEMSAVPAFAAVQNLLLLFSPHTTKEEEGARNELASQQISVLGVQRFADGAQGGLKVDRRIFAAQCYAKLILALREQMERARPDSGIDPRLPKIRAVRVVQDLVELCGDRMDFLLRLGMNRAGSYRRELHGANTCVLSISMGYAIGFQRQDLVDIGMGALFHQVAGPESERDAARSSFGRLLRVGHARSGWLRAVIAAESCVGDGEVLPWGGVRPRAHVYARITGVASAYSRLTLGMDPRFRRPVEPLDALAMLQRDQEGKIDPDLADLLINLLRAYPVGCEVRLDTGERAIVRSQIAGSRWDRPIVSVLGTDQRRVDLMRQEGGRFVARIIETIHPPEAPLPDPPEIEPVDEEQDPTLAQDLLVVPVEESKVNIPIGDLELDLESSPSDDGDFEHITDFGTAVAPLQSETPEPHEHTATGRIELPIEPSNDEPFEIEPIGGTIKQLVEREGIELDLESSSDELELEPIAPGRMEETDPITELARAASSAGFARPQVLGRYLLEDEIPSGPRSELNGRDTRDGSEVRLRLFDLKGLSGRAKQETIAAYEREARVAARICHPALPRLVDQGEEADRLCLVYEPLIGDPLSRFITPGVPFAAQRARRIIRCLAEALHHLHERGIIHGEVNASNVRVAPGDRATLATLDRATGVASRDDGYDEREEQRALGLLLIGLFTGHFRPSTTMESDAYDPLTADLSDIAERMIDRDPSKRYASCEVVAMLLTRGRAELVEG
jgi:HD-GYP domain-containing protein (c-di-GMP phosphodiesterase class II)